MRPAIPVVAGILAGLCVLTLAACDEHRLPPPGTYVAEHDTGQSIIIHEDKRITFDVRVSGGWRNAEPNRLVHGEYTYTVDADGGIVFSVSSNSAAGLDLARYRWAWRDGVILRTDPDTGEEMAYFGLE